MILIEHTSLLPYNTFHIDEEASILTEITSIVDVLTCLDIQREKQLPLYIIGGGSNILLTKDVNGIVLLNKMKGIEIVHEDETYVYVKFQGGELWHECVLWCVNQNLSGIENLSLIPGTIGAAPIQNIGAYGVELQDTFIELEAFHLQTKETRIFKKVACEFGYRTSIFKTNQKGNYFILSVTLKLSKQPTFNTSYGNIQDELNKMGIDTLSVKAISDAVIQIRQSKLPDPAVIGNAGSFFKNPVVTETIFNSVKHKYPEVPFYPIEDGIKIPAAWLIEHCHPENAPTWKGYSEGNFGVHAKQALCLVNYSNAKGIDIYNLSERIITSVQHAFNITLEREVNIW